MPSKKSKQRLSPVSPWKAARGCSEAALAKTAAELALVLRKGDRVLLEGPMGAGKTTFARELLRALGVHQPPEGSPSFAIAHEYDSPKGSIVHIDFYRLRSEGELEDAGIPAYFWERTAIVISEWLSMFPDFEAAVKRTGRTWMVQLGFGEHESERDLEILFTES